MTGVRPASRWVTRGLVALTVELAPVPPDWMHSVYTAVRALSAAGRLPEGTQATSREDALALDVPDELPAAQVRELIDELIAETHRAFEARLQQWAKADQRLIEAAAPYQAAVAFADNERFGAIQASADHAAGAERISISVATTLPADLDEREVASALRNHPAAHAEGATFSGGRFFFLDGVEAEDARDLILAAVETIETNAARLTEERAAREQRIKTLIEDLQRGLAVSSEERRGALRFLAVRRLDAPEQARYASSRPAR